jgi:hypothetical protein
MKVRTATNTWVHNRQCSLPTRILPDALAVGARELKRSGPNVVDLKKYLPTSKS